MVRKFRSIALAGALMVIAAPAFAQDNPLGLPFGLPVGVDLDPFHIFTPAPAPAAAPLPAASVKHKRVMHKKMMKKKK